MNLLSLRNRRCRPSPSTKELTRHKDAGRDGEFLFKNHVSVFEELGPERLERDVRTTAAGHDFRHDDAIAQGSAAHVLVIKLLLHVELCHLPWCLRWVIHPWQQQQDLEVTSGHQFLHTSPAGQFCRLSC